MDIEPDPHPDADPARWLARAAARAPDAPALSWSGGELCFRGLETRVAVTAGQLAPHGARVRTLVLAPGTRLELALGLYAGLGLGLRLLPLNDRLPASEQRRLCELAGPDRALVGDPGRARDLDCLPLSVDPWAPAPTAPCGMPATRGGGQLLIATSGSGGRPRLVLLTAANLAASVAASRERIPLGRGDCWLVCLPLYHVGGLAILLRALEAGAAVRLHGAFDASRVWRELVAGGVTHLSLVPAMLHRLLEAAAGVSPPPGLRCVLVGGAALDPDLARCARAAGWPLCVTYGMSETASQVATLCGAQAGRVPGRVGRPLAGFEVRVRDPDAAGVGRIRVRGPAVMAGYGEPGVGLDGGWLETGDLGRLDAAGELQVLGRADQVLVSAGEKVHPEQVEPVLRACPGVRDAALAGLPDPVWGECLVAVFQGDLDAGRLEHHCRDHLAGARRPRRFLRVQALPRGAAGKLDRAALRRLVAERLG